MTNTSSEVKALQKKVRKLEGKQEDIWEQISLAKQEVTQALRRSVKADKLLSKITWYLTLSDIRTPLPVYFLETHSNEDPEAAKLEQILGSNSYHYEYSFDDNDGKLRAADGLLRISFISVDRLIAFITEYEITFNLEVIDITIENLTNKLQEMQTLKQALNHAVKK